jgi:hypothetical protein
LNISDHIYFITIFTGHESNAGSAANAFVTVSGENGDTKEVELKKNQGNVVVPPFKSGRYRVLHMYSWP